MELIDINRIRPSLYQPREGYDQEKMRQLAESIRKVGLLQPLVIRPANGFFEIVCGERRWKACKVIGMSEVPAEIRELKDKEAMIISLSENIHREDLQPLEKAKAINNLRTKAKMSNKEISEEIGMPLPSVEDYLSLIELPKEVKKDIKEEAITFSHAREVAEIKDKELQKKLVEKIKKKEIPSGRPTEKLISVVKKAPEHIKKAVIEDELNPEIGKLIMEIDDKKLQKSLVKKFLKEKRGMEEAKRILEVVKSASPPLRNELCIPNSKITPNIAESLIKVGDEKIEKKLIDELKEKSYSEDEFIIKVNEAIFDKRRAYVSNAIEELRHCCERFLEINPAKFRKINPQDKKIVIGYLRAMEEKINLIRKELMVVE
ncbi:MAG: ParB/RepB/Spo0J family partition protein [Candidatus Thermoplasmatota archaeon]